MKILAVSLLLFLCMYESARAQSDWPMASRDREQTSWAKDEQRLAPPFDMRVIQCPSPIAEAFDKYSPYLIYGQGMLYLAIDNTPNWLVPVQPETGSSPWYGAISGSCCSVGSSPTLSGNVVIQGGQNFSAMLTGFDRTSGSVLWEKPTGSMYARNTVADEGRLYYRLEEMTCLDAETGAEIWTIPLPGYPNVGTPAVDDSNVYFTYEDTLFAVDKLDGARKWFVAGAGHEGLSVDDSRVYFNRKSAVFAVDKHSGAREWTHTIPGNLELAFINGNSIAIDDSHLLYVIWANKDSMATLTMLDKHTGALGWTHTFPGEGTFAPTIANAIVYIVNWKTRSLWGLDISTGDVVFQEPSRSYWAQPIVANGTLYVNSPNADSSGYAVVAFNAKPNARRSIPAPDEFSCRVYPNPLTNRGVLQYTLPRESSIQIDVFTTLGQHIDQVFDGIQEPGTHEFHLNVEHSLRSLAAGSYLLRIATNSHSRVFPLHILR